jgi:uncharacterized protein Yka (UPF0111/DUF47 family)
MKVTFPLEAEATIRRRMLNICQDHARAVVDIVRELTLMIDSIAEEKPKKVKEHYENMLKLVESGNKLKANLLEEVASVGSLLISREGFLRLIFELERIADYAEAVGYRLESMMEGKWKIEHKFMKSISELMSMVLDEITKVRETMISLGFNPDRAIEASKAVEDAENRINVKHRGIDLEVLSSKMPVQAILLLRDVLDRLENIADTGVNVIDMIRVLAIYS